MGKHALSHEEFLERMTNINSNIEFLSQYKRSNISINCRCIICNTTWVALPSSLLMGNKSCPNCSNNNSGSNLKLRKAKLLRVTDHKTFLKRMNIINPNIEFLSDYIQSRKLISCKCKLDGYQWQEYPKILLKGKRCPECIVSEKTQIIKEKLKIINPNVEIIDKCYGTNKKTKVKCLIDGYTWSALVTNLMSGKGCPKCAGNIKKTPESFVEKLKTISPNLTIIGEYKSRNSLIEMKCEKNHVWHSTPNNLLLKRGCPKCARNKQKTTEEFISELKLLNPNICIIGEYFNAITKIKCKCLIDGYEWFNNPQTLLRGVRCPQCRKRDKRCY